MKKRSKFRPKRSTNPTESMRYAAGRLGVGINQTYAYARAGKIPIIQVGKRILLLVEPFERQLAGGE